MESSSRHQAQNAHTVATGQPSPIHKASAKLIDVNKLAAQVAATLALLPPDERKRELENIRRNNPHMIPLLQAQRATLPGSGELALDISNRDKAPGA